MRAAAFVICLLPIAAALLTGVAEAGPIQPKSSKEELKELQVSYVMLNSLLKSKLKTDNLEANFRYAHELKELEDDRSPSAHAPALALFLELGWLKEWYSCNEGDMKQLSRNQEALARINKKERVYVIFTQISKQHAIKCQEDYELRFAKLRNQLDSELQRTVFAVMDPFVMQNQRLQQKQRSNSGPLAFDTDSQQQQQQQMNSHPAPTIDVSKLPTVQTSIGSDSGGKDRVKSYLSNPGLMSLALHLGWTNAAEATKAAAESKRVKRSADNGHDAKPKIPTLAAIKRMYGAGLLATAYGHKQRVQEGPQASRPVADKLPVIDASTEAEQEQQQQAPASPRKRLPAFVRRLGIKNLPFLPASSAASSVEKPATSSSPSSVQVTTNDPGLPDTMPRLPARRPERRPEKLEINLTMRSIMSGNYQIDIVKGSKLLQETLSQLANQEDLELNIKRDGIPKVKAKIGQFVDAKVTQPCKQFHAHYKKLFEVVIFDLKYNSGSSNGDFYRTFAHYQLCDSFLKQEKQIRERVADFWRQDLNFRQPTKPVVEPVSGLKKWFKPRSI